MPWAEGPGWERWAPGAWPTAVKKTSVGPDGGRKEKRGQRSETRMGGRTVRTQVTLRFQTGEIRTRKQQTKGSQVKAPGPQVEMWEPQLEGAAASVRVLSAAVVADAVR